MTNLPLPAEPQFIVRAFPSDVSKPSVDLRRDYGLDTAIVEARTAALDGGARYRQVMVTDDRGMAWAIFNMLWSLYEGNE